MRYALALLTLVLVAAPAAAQTAAVSLDDVVRGVEAAYSRMTDLKAEISQTSFNKSLNQTIPAAGTVYLKKGGKLRWEYTEPTRRLIVSLDPNGWQVRKAVVHDQFENTVTMKFSKLAINSGLEDKLFAFVPPKGVATVPLK